MFALAGTHALDHDEVQPRRHSDSSLTAMSRPRRWLQMNRMPAAQRLQHASQQMPPREERLVPGQVVPVDDCRVGHRIRQARGHRRLTGSTTPVHRNDARSRRGCPRAIQYELDELPLIDRTPPVDGWLTKLSDPLVLYNEADMTGIRAPWDIPVEDFAFGFGMVTLAMVLWVHAGRREERRAGAAPGTAGPRQEQRA